MSRKTLARDVINDIARLARELGRVPTKEDYLIGGGVFSEDTINLAFSSWQMGVRAAGLVPSKLEKPEAEEKREPKILLFDIETSPYEVYAWGLYDQNIGLPQIKKERHLLSFAAKWYGKPFVLYKDQRDKEDISDDKSLCEILAALFNEADVIVTQNGKKFDERFVKGRMLLHGVPPYNPIKHIDILQLARKFDLTSRKLEYMSGKFSENKKSKHEEFPGMELWIECLKGNVKAWDVMRDYNRMDVISMEPVFEALRPWGVGVDLNAFHSDNVYRCQCGSTKLQKRGFTYTSAGKFQKFQCTDCGAWHSAKGAENNHMGGVKKSSMKTPKA